MSHQPDAAWITLDAAAARLGISPDATRKRLDRGSLAGEKRAGRWYVLLDEPDTSDAATGRQSTGQPDADRTPLDAMSGAARELIDQLKSENGYLRDQLDQTRRDQVAERERFDVLIRESLHRIEALTAGDTAEQPEPATEPHVASPAGPGREEPVSMSQDTLQSRSMVADWFHRMFGKS